MSPIHSLSNSKLSKSKNKLHNCLYDEIWLFLLLGEERVQNRILQVEDDHHDSFIVIEIKQKLKCVYGLHGGSGSLSENLCSIVDNLDPPLSLETPDYSNDAMGTSVLDFIIRWMMISAKRQKSDRSSPTSNITRGK